MMSMLTRIEPENNMDRWYFVDIQPTLFEPWAVVCAWGNRRTRYARMRSLPAESLKAAEEIATDIVARKVRRGYLIAGSKKMQRKQRILFIKGEQSAKEVALKNGQ
jgi:predicted DNA-binding WGR domain protein